MSEENESKSRWRTRDADQMVATIGILFLGLLQLAGAFALAAFVLSVGVNLWHGELTASGLLEDALFLAVLGLPALWARRVSNASSYEPDQR